MHRRPGRAGLGPAAFGHALPWLLLAALATTPVRARDSDCERVLAEGDVSLDAAAAAGCELSAQQIGELMDNPVGELITVPIQYDRLTVEEPLGGSEVEVETLKLIPTFPTRLGDRWTLVNRVVFPWVKVPIDTDELGRLGTRPGTPLLTGAPGAEDLFTGSTTSFGDLTYVGLVTPREPPEVAGGKLVWALGPTVVMPTARDDVLGQGKYQLGPAAALGWLGPRWTLGALAQHWWSVAGDDDRSSISQTNVQYFVYRKLGRQWSLGAAPNITIDWLGDDAPTVIAPLGIGLNKTLLLGKLPVRFGLELYRYVVQEGEIDPQWGLRFSATPVVPSAFLPW